MEISSLIKSVRKKMGRAEGGKVAGFLKVALGDFSHVASVFPSSAWATRSVAKHIQAGARVIVEYGPGNGAMTRQLLKRLSREAQLVAIEVNPNFARELKQWGESRLKIVEANVIEISGKLKDVAPHGVDAVVSGIPFSFLTAAERDQIVWNTKQSLTSGGRFIVYQNSPKMSEYLKPHFVSVKTYFEPRNVFPYFIMVATA